MSVVLALNKRAFDQTLKSRLVGGVFVRLLTDLKGFIIHSFRCPPIFPPTNAPSEKCTSLDLTVQQSVKFWA